MKTEIKTEKKYILVNSEDDFVSAVLTESELLKQAVGMRKEYIKDGVDDAFIKECYPTEIENMETARRWYSDFGDAIVEVPEKLNETQRILTKLFKDNGKICAEIKRKEQDYFDQGTWSIAISILDIDEDNKARLQIKARKICPSGAWDNGIEVVDHPQTSLYVFNKDIDTTVSDIIRKYFRSDRGTCGREYKVLRYSL